MGGKKSWLEQKVGGSVYFILKESLKASGLENREREKEDVVL